MKRLLLSLVLAISLISCASKTASLTAPQQITFTLNQSLSAVATINKSLATDVIALNASGLITKDLTNSVLTWQKVVALDVIAAVTVQRGTATDADKVIALKAAFLNSLTLPPDVVLLLKNPQSDQAVIGLLTTIQTIQILIRTLAGA